MRCGPGESAARWKDKWVEPQLSLGTGPHRREEVARPALRPPHPFTVLQVPATGSDSVGRNGGRGGRLALPRVDWQRARRSLPAVAILHASRLRWVRGGAKRAGPFTEREGARAKKKGSVFWLVARPQPSAAEVYIYVVSYYDSCAEPPTYRSPMG